MNGFWTKILKTDIADRVDTGSGGLTINKLDEYLMSVIIFSREIYERISQ